MIIPLPNIKDGAWLIPGKYSLSVTGLRGMEFEPVEVTADGPELVVFRARGDMVYHGRVLDGSTGEPLAGAFVMAERSHMQGASLAQLGRGQWDALHKLGAEPDVDDPAFEPVKEVFEFSRVVRTDAEGYFEMEMPAKAGRFHFVFFEQDYLAVTSFNTRGKPDESGFVQTQTARLFPAAKVLFKPVVADGAVKAFGWPRGRLKWYVDAEQCPGWASEILRPCESGCRPGDSQLNTTYKRVHVQHVPALVSMELCFDMWLSTKWSNIYYPAEGAIVLGKGQMLDLTGLELVPRYKVQVRVSDSEGEVLETVPVSVWSRGRKIGSAQVTDKYGVAEIGMDPNSTGQFVVEAGEDDPAVEGIDYDLGGVEDANSVFEFELSEEMVKLLLREE